MSVEKSQREAQSISPEMNAENRKNNRVNIVNEWTEHNIYRLFCGFELMKMALLPKIKER
jgi:hypothetical protein